MNKLSQKLLEQISNLHEIPAGAVSFRENGVSKVINSTANIEITKKTDKAGIDIFVKKGTKNESLHIPVVITESGINDIVYNDFNIADNAEILIVAGCGVHAENGTSSHRGIHSFKIGKNCVVKYVERHLGVGKGGKNLSPTTKITLGENSVFEMETLQIGGVNFAERNTTASLKTNAKLLINEKILTTEMQFSNSKFLVKLIGKNSRAELVSRVVAKDFSKQVFSSNLVGKNECFGRVECDGILMHNAKISSTPKIMAENSLASLSHEAQIGKIAGEQLLKLMTLGLSETDAENEIIAGYLK